MTSLKFRAFERETTSEIISQSSTLTVKGDMISAGFKDSTFLKAGFFWDRMLIILESWSHITVTGH